MSEQDQGSLAHKAGDTSASEAVSSQPSVIVQDVHVTYKVIGSQGKRAQARRADSLWKRFVRRTARMTNAGSTNIEALRGVSFVAHQGEAIGILGSNGSGKSTLLRVIAGLQPVAYGQVYTRGRASLMGVGAALVKNLTGERNIMIGGLALGLSVKEVKAKFDDIVKFAELGDAVYLPMETYSSGMAARLRFAISTAVTPDVLIVDEALSTGDAAFRAKSRRRIDQIRAEAGTVFVVSHSLATIRSMCSRAIWIDEGVVRMDGPVSEVADAYRAYSNQKRVERRRRRRLRRLRRQAAAESGTVKD